MSKTSQFPRYSRSCCCQAAGAQYHVPSSYIRQVCSTLATPQSPRWSWGCCCRAAAAQTCVYLSWSCRARQGSAWLTLALSRSSLSHTPQPCFPLVRWSRPWWQHPVAATGSPSLPPCHRIHFAWCHFTLELVQKFPTFYHFVCKEQKQRSEKIQEKWKLV